MRLGGLSLFSRTSSRSSFNIASYHSPHSLTWSWILSVNFDRMWRKPNGWPRAGVYPHRNNNGLQIVVTMPCIVVHLHRQREMWYKDMYRSASDREEKLERRVRKLRRDVTMARVTALLPPDDSGKAQ